MFFISTLVLLFILKTRFPSNRPISGKDDNHDTMSCIADNSSFVMLSSDLQSIRAFATDGHISRNRSSIAMRLFHLVFESRIMIFRALSELNSEVFHFSVETF